MSVKDITDGRGQGGGHSGVSATWRMKCANHLSPGIADQSEQQNKSVVSQDTNESSKVKHAPAEQRPDKGAPSGSHWELLQPYKSFEGLTIWVVQFVFDVLEALSSVPASKNR